MPTAKNLSSPTRNSSPPNWSTGRLSDSVTRLVVRLGIAYGCDTQQVQQLLLRVAADTPSVLKNPPPKAVFMGFSEKWMDFELRVFVGNVDALLLHAASIERGHRSRFPRRRSGTGPAANDGAAGHGQPQQVSPASIQSRPPLARKRPDLPVTEPSSAASAPAIMNPQLCRRIHLCPMRMPLRKLRRFRGRYWPAAVIFSLWAAGIAILRYLLATGEIDRGTANGFTDLACVGGLVLLGLWVMFLSPFRRRTRWWCDRGAGRGDRRSGVRSQNSTSRRQLAPVFHVALERQAR